MLISVLFALATAETAALVGPDPAAYERWLTGEALRADTQFALGAACPSAKVVHLTWTPNAAPVLMSDKGIRAMTDGPIVVEHLQVTGCGRDGQQNLLVFPLKVGGWKSVAMLQGTGRTDIVLQHDAMRSAIMTAIVGKPPLKCAAEEVQRTLRLGLTRISQPVDASGAWKEIWPIQVCGQDRPVELSFTPDPIGGGTSFAAREGWAKP